MEGEIYSRRLQRMGLECLVPDEGVGARVQAAIFEELCRAAFNERTTELFLTAINELRSRGVECAILGCTGIPLVVAVEHSSLPAVDSTRLLAKYAISEALTSDRLSSDGAWLTTIVTLARR